MSTAVIQSALETIKTNSKNFGVAKTAYDIAYRAINKVGAHLMILQCMIADHVNEKMVVLPEGYRASLLSREELDRFIGPEYELDAAFLDDAFKKGDECMGVLYGDELASYGWYSRSKTAVAPGLYMHFNPDYTYMYKGFTIPAHRGKRLHAIGMTLALKHYLENGSKGLISFVEDNNFSSLASTKRMGYWTFGKIFIFGLGGKYFISSDKESKKRGFEVQVGG